MVPPISVQDVTPITRIGDQMTYVFFKDGIESFVIRPGFSGKVDEFGMLIPFPTPPAIRKVSDDIFPQIAAAIDPPEVVVDLRYRLRRGAAVPQSNAPAKATGLETQGRDRVRVIREEAVGMYEVAVLEAGSAAALKRWMDDHKYKYPQGMDAVCDEYVELGWCFVAVKTRVSGPKSQIDPKPGMRAVDTKLPAGSTFDGFVQAMGFRFPTKELVVPMRLSAFNAGELHNIVYILTDGPRRIRSIPEEYVVRQVSGEDLYRNVTQKLPLRIIGGSEADINDLWHKSLEQQRDPVPHNGQARDLFAGDLLAVSAGRLSHPHEEAEKMLLRIGEHLGLRGPAIDQQNLAALAAERDKALSAALADLKKMTLSVIDGDFPREVLAQQNLTFAEYHMPARRNKPEMYDAKTKKPGEKKEGILKLGALTPAPEGPQPSKSRAAASRPWVYTLLGLGLAALGLAWARWWGRMPDSSRRRGVPAAAVLLALACWAVLASPASAADEKEILALIDQLEDAQKADAAVEGLIKVGEPAVKHLLGEALEGESIIKRGWSIVCLAEIGGHEVNQRLAELHNDGQQPMLVRTWAAAARVHQATQTKELVELAPLVGTFPALGRPVGMKLIAKLADKDQPVSAEDVMAIELQVPQLGTSLAPVIMGFGTAKLVDVLVNTKNQQVGNRAAAYLGTLAQQGDESVAPAVAKAYAFDPNAKEVAWKSGALWIPGINWDQKNARTLVSHLISWHLWCERKGLQAQQQQINNNLISLQLAQAAGYQSPGFGNFPLDQWLQVWGQAVGKAELEKLLAQQGVEKEARYKKILDQLR
jgi:hypothetical protein